MQIVKFNVASFRQLEEPMGEVMTFRILCPFDSLPENLPTEGNPRKQNMKSKVAKSIVDEIYLNKTGSFHLLNKGMTILAKQFRYIPRTNEVELTFDNPIQGVIDGGHTYRAILENRHATVTQQYVSIEIIINADEIFSRLAKTRNLSQQVETKSLLEIEGKFDLIKVATAKEPYANTIAYKTNAEGFIDVVTIVQIISLFNVERYNDKNHPSSLHRNRNTTVLDYERELTRGEYSYFLRAIDLIPDFLRLYNHVESKIPSLFNKLGHKFSKMNGVSYKNGDKIYRRRFSKGKFMEYEVPLMYVFPLIGAFRMFIKLNTLTKKYEWISNVNVIEIFDEVAEELVAEYDLHYGENKGAVSDMTRRSSLWRDLYKIVENVYPKYVDELEAALV